jgi:hypothetical protein
MILEPNEVAKISLPESIKNKLIHKIVDKDKREAFLVDRLGSQMLVNHLKELIRSSESDLVRWQSDNWEEWDVAECDDAHAFFLYPSDKGLSHIISSSTEENDEDRDILRSDDPNLACVDSVLLGVILTLRALHEACDYRGYSYDNSNILDHSAYSLMRCFEDAIYHLYETPEHPELTDDMKMVVDKIREIVHNQLD